MMPILSFRVSPQAVAMALLLVVAVPDARADAWLLQPSLAFDQRFDDNYRIEPGGSEQVSASRIVGSLGLSRESATTSHAALLRVDGLLEQSDIRDDDLQSNQTLALDSNYFGQRSQVGIGLLYKRDRPNQDIGTDLTDAGQSALDTGADANQDSSVDRERIDVEPTWSYDLTRRSRIEAGIRLTDVQHGLTDPRDALIDRYVTLQNADNLNPAFDADIPLDELDFDDVGVFTIDDELDDFREARLTLAWRYQLSAISTLTLSTGFSDYRSDTEAQENVQFAFDDKTPDPEQRTILRDPRREALSNTTTLRIGYQRALSSTVEMTAEIGVFRTDIDDSDLLRDDDVTNFSSEEDRQQALDDRIATEDGWLAALSFTRDMGVQRLAARIGVDVEPSDLGSQVEAFEFTGDYLRQINPRLDVRFNVRAYEPDAIDPGDDDDFQRRFLSIEPKLVWQWSRAWTVAASYRYRRQRSQTDIDSGESNAVLFSLVYSPPSALAAAAAER